jgi:spermidine synthase
MSIGFQHPNVKVHIGDGFKFLEDYKNEFDVIITDSSDPEGPAESLFQKPYFELLNGALREGGVITTQGCSWPFFSPFDLTLSQFFEPIVSFPPSPHRYQTHAFSLKVPANSFLAIDFSPATTREKSLCAFSLSFQPKTNGSISL